MPTSTPPPYTPRPRLTLPTLLRRSLLHRRARSLSALVALTVSAAIATALLTLYADLDHKLHTEFRSFGANIILTPRSPNTPLPPNALALTRQIAGPEARLAPFAFAVATTDRGTPIVAVGTNLSDVRQLDAWWKVDTWPQPPTRVPQVPILGPGSATDPAPAATTIPPVLLGQRAANFIADEHPLILTYAGRPLALSPVSHLSTGGDEDSRVYLPLPAFTAWTGLSPTVLELQVPGSAATINATITRLERALPTLQINPVRQLVEGESRIVDRTHALMLGSVLLIALTVAVSVLATLSASVLERRRDFALMKALGGSQRQLLSLFLLETTLVALAGVLLGWILGSLAAFSISELNFNTATVPSLSVLPAVLLLNLAIAALAATFPARVLRRLQPAALLKGD